MKVLFVTVGDTLSRRTRMLIDALQRTGAEVETIDSKDERLQSRGEIDLVGLDECKELKFEIHAREEIKVEPFKHRVDNRENLRQMLDRKQRRTRRRSR